MLFGASCYFYAAFIPKYLLILFLLIGIDYVAGLLIEPARGARRRLYLVASVVANIGLLALFKYYNFFSSNLTAALGAAGVAYTSPHLDLMLPIGLSFHTFQSLSYTFEVYYGRFKAERHPGIYAVYVLFFPQMVAGPIERPHHVIPQLHQPHAFSYDNAVAGLRLILLGMAKKVLIADNLALIADAAFGSPRSHGGPALVWATYCFALQIYCDFSGYSDIARGSARVMGIELMNNFASPYSSRSVREFWSRWHISLSSWFRDYLYVPLGGNRVSPARHALNLMIVFVLSGLWHGANWTYVLWGAIHGAYLVASAQRRRLWPWLTLGASRWADVLRAVITFHLCCFAWIFFRARSIADALYIATRLHRGWQWPAVVGAVFSAPLPIVAFYAAVVLVFGGAEIAFARGWWSGRLERTPAAVRWTAYAVIVTLTFLGGRLESKQFIYFQF